MLQPNSKLSGAICALPICAVGHSRSTTACVMRYHGTYTHLVSHLMCNDVSHTPEVRQAGMLRIYQQGSFSVGDEAPVLHSPSSKVRDANQVQLWQRVWDPKQGLKSWQHLHSDVKGCFQIPSPAPAT